MQKYDFFIYICNMSAIRKYLAVLALVLLPLLAGAQGDSLRFSAKGVVRDAVSGQILQAVAVTLPGTSFATITNADGTFVIKSDKPIARVAFSILGYKALEMQAPDSPSEVMRVRMNRDEFSLNAATVLSGNPRELLRLALYRVPDNSPAQAELFDCFYRETVQKRQRFIYVSEAVTKMYKSSFKDFMGIDRAAVVKSRLLTSPRKSDTLGVKVLGGPAMSVELDLIKNRRAPFTESELNLYSFTLLPPKLIDGRMQLVIAMLPAVETEYALNYGTVYIDRETLSFTRIELNLDMSDPAKAAELMLVRRPAGLRFRPKEMSLVLDYKREDGKTRLSYLKTVFRFNCDWKKKLFATEFTAVAEMVVTKRHTGPDVVQIPRTEAFSHHQSLADKTGFYSDPDFWKDYNIIEPTVGLEHAVARLKAAP